MIVFQNVQKKLCVEVDCVCGLVAGSWLQKAIALFLFLLLLNLSARFSQATSALLLISAFNILYIF